MRHYVGLLALVILLTQRAHIHCETTNGNLNTKKNQNHALVPLPDTVFTAPARCGASAIQNPLNPDEFLLFGGGTAPEPLADCDECYLADLWSWNSQTKWWREIPTKGLRKPAGRKGHAMGGFISKDAAEVSVTGWVLIFGGYRLDESGNGLRFNDLWRFDLTTTRWMQLHPRGGGDVPDPRSHPAAVSVQNSSHTSVTCGNQACSMFIFGGWDGRHFFNDLWGVAMRPIGDAPLTSKYVEPVWQKQPIRGREVPPPRRGCSMVYNEKLGVLVVFGGVGNENAGRGRKLNDVWAYSFYLQEWEQLAGNSFAAPDATWRPPPLTYSVVNLLFDRYMVVATGFDGESTVNGWWVFDLLAREWQVAHCHEVENKGCVLPSSRSLGIGVPIGQGTSTQYTASDAHPTTENGATNSTVVVMFGGWREGQTSAVLNDLWKCSISVGTVVSVMLSDHQGTSAFTSSNSNLTSSYPEDPYTTPIGTTTQTNVTSDTSSQSDQQPKAKTTASLETRLIISCEKQQTHTMP